MRHRNEHLPFSAIAAKDAEEAEETEGDAPADDFLDQVRDLQERALAILEEAEEAEELNAALRVIREVKGNLELMTEPLNELDERSVDETAG